ncbi:hypothetical protein MOF38_18275 [Bacillus haynesii]|uniref:hypothetical protein n=1 Tax=Bacillus haynesii TaxID=1925021 RepID=UPI00227F9D18|nr:hypothetical protein [Bacillus haynesii]MCY7771223.1 hypothetical protein [Bacillus haynesii]MCY8014332.1 hypothetical protein [Bacillus haynesii]MCY8347568.1 hypothetical protein [Bacillus haynesii]MCY8351132.1 hypothetical protein [Bacillus haynesii]MCY8559883.1 hypothetical protein [Bacillus haynesii]
MEPDSLFKTLLKYKDRELILEWENGLRVIGKTDTFFETDNGLEDDDINYKEYYATVFQVNKILSPPVNNEEDSLYNWLLEEKNFLVEISLYEDTPNKILVDGNTIWELDSDE